MDQLSINPDQHLKMTLLGANRATVSCYPKELIGRRLIARVSDRVPPDACVEIHHGDVLLLGEIRGCWQEDALVFAAIELREALSGIEQLQALFAKFGIKTTVHRESPKLIA